MIVGEIGYRDCVDVLLKMWMDNVLTDGEYWRILDKLNAREIQNEGKTNEEERMNKDDMVTAFGKFMTAQYDAEERGEKEFTCPLCGGKARWARTSYNGHIRAKCEGCGIRVME